MKIEDKIKCAICGKECNNLRCLSQHIRRYHFEISNREYYNKYSKKENKKNYIKCKFKIDDKECGKECRNLKCLTNHIGIHKITSKEYYDIYLKKENEGTCLECGKETNFSGILGYFKYCSIKCSNKNKQEIEKRNQTNREKNKKDPNRPKEILEKRSQTEQDLNKKNPNRPKEILEKSRHAQLNKYGVDNIFKDIEYIKKCTFNKLGVSYAPQSKEVINLIKQTRIKNGTWLSDDQLSDFTIYSRLVFHFTYLSLKKKFSKEELEKRKLAGTDDGLHGDHKFSVIKGFEENILPCIIGCQSNLELLSWINNIKKGSKCSITKEKLFELYELEINQKNVKNF